jgi:outer membrane receptor protein involved in Fe transport
MLRLIDRGGSGATVTLGAEHWNLLRERLGAREELSGGGQGTAALYRDDVRNTGYFGQLKLDFSRALFVTAGLRGERNSTFGEDYGTAWSPMLGAVVTRDAGSTTTKFRLAYGKGIRPPAPSARKDIATVNFQQQANPLLEPETQAGVEGGVELYTGDRASLSLTGYLQRANGLIQEVIVNRQTTIQYQNVGRIANRGVEIEGSARRGPLRALLNFAVTDSRVRALSSTYSGDLAVGDRVPEVPGSSGLATLTLDLGRAELALGTTFVGSWSGYDWPAFLSATSDSSGTAPRLRDYLRDYPSVIKPFLSVSRGFHRGMEWFGRIDNLTNVQRSERDNLQISAGRTVTVGVKIGR